MRYESSKVLIIFLYVDEFMIGCNDLSMLNSTKEELSRRLKINNMGEFGFTLGTHTERNRKFYTVIMQQTRYTEKVIKHFEI